jgi:hypothetical protein
MADTTQWYRRPENPPRGGIHRTGGYDEVVCDERKSEYRCLLNGELHRLDGPALQTRDANHYYRKGQLHRTNGPAIVRRNGQNEYYLDGKDCGSRFSVIMADLISAAPDMVISVPVAYKAYTSGLYDASDVTMLQMILPKHATLEGALNEIKRSRPMRR